jgi:hypothetical protein
MVPTVTTALHIVRRPLHPVIMCGLGVWSCHPFGIMGVVALRVVPAALRISGGPSFGCGAFGGNQRNPRHGDLVAFLHELGLREHAAVTQPKARRNTRL